MKRDAFLNIKITKSKRIWMQLKYASNTQGIHEERPYARRTGEKKKCYTYWKTRNTILEVKPSERKEPDTAKALKSRVFVVTWEERRTPLSLHVLAPVGKVDRARNPLSRECYCSRLLMRPGIDRIHLMTMALYGGLWKKSSHKKHSNNLKLYHTEGTREMYQSYST